MAALALSATRAAAGAAALPRVTVHVPEVPRPVGPSAGER
jgi:hypothetical protein